MEDTKTQTEQKPKTHIDQVIDTITAIGTFDLNHEVFKDYLTTNFFRENFITIENVPALLALRDNTAVVKAYKILIIP